jgi:predicted nucleotidyltransferase
MVLDDQVRQRIVDRILSVSSPERIIVFGSAATGSMNRDSDIDLLVLEESSEHPRARGLKIRGALKGLEYPFDVFVMRPERFEQTKDVIGGLAYPANKYGRVVYQRAA